MDSKNKPALSQVGGTKVSRRTVARGAAWSVPVAAVAVSAPAFAASQVCVPTITLSPDSCKCPGQSTAGEPWAYFLRFCITDANDCDVETGTPFQVTRVVSNSGRVLVSGTGDNCGFATLAQASGTTGTIGGCTPLIRLLSTNSAAKLIITYTVDGGDPQTVTVPAPPNCSAISEIAQQRCTTCTE